MNRWQRRLGAFIITLAAAGWSAAAGAQATRTWVSGVGDDVNPCSRTAPCKTFAGALSKTAAGGEINCLDPGGFGAVTITKSIAILCDGLAAGVLGTGTFGVVVNAGANDSVFLSGLDFHGGGSGAAGIRLVQARLLHVRNATIRMYRTGISVEAGAAAAVIVDHSAISENGTGVQAASGNTRVIVKGSTITGNGTGLAASGGAKILSGGGNLLAANGTDGSFGGEAGGR